MEFLSFDALTKTLTLKKGPVPKPGPNDVLIKVAYCGVCGTDIHILEGSFPCKKNEPLTLGHEFAGSVEAIGSGVKTFKVGQRVVVDPNNGCDLCNDCHTGCYHLCLIGSINNTIGIFRNGGWATHCVVPESQVFLVPDGVEMPLAALSEPLSCLAHGWDIMNPINVGKKVLVVGAGIIGLLWACLLHLHGLRKTVTISEPQDSRRKMAKDLGLDYEVTTPGDLKNNEFDVAVDCSGYGPAIESAIQSLTHGGRLCIFGVADPKTKISIEPFQIYKKELSISGVMINPYTFPRGLNLLSAMADSYLQFEKLGIKVYLLSEYKKAFEDLKKGNISKAVFKL